MGNIATYAAPGKGTVTYTYDNQDQLLKAAGDTTYTYTYDGAGNILTASDGTATHSYTYGDTDWKDLLTAFDGQAITYDAIGNPTSYFNGTRWNFTWVNGRTLATASDGTNSLSFAYDASGLRTSKTVNGTTYRYYYAGGKLMRMSWGANIIDFFYDESGLPYAMKYNGAVYYYVTNLQGDVMRIVDASGTVMASYDYDPYGKVISATGTLANINPLHYRGYVYDQETGFYYLQSRYYDPEIGRFINADTFYSTGQGVIGCNMFAYCGNDPVEKSDAVGEMATLASAFSQGAGETIRETMAALSYVYAGFGALAAADGPLPFLDIVALIGSAGLTVGISGYAFGKTLHSKVREKAQTVSASEVYSPEKQYNYWSATIQDGVIVPINPLTYSEARIWVEMGNDLLCRNYAAAYAIVKFYPSARWDRRHSCTDFRYLNHFHLSSAHGNHIWYFGD